LRGFRRFIRRQRGEDMVEYALLAALISTVTLSAVMFIGPSIKPAYYKLEDAVRRAAAAHFPAHPGNDGGGTPTQ